MGFGLEMLAILPLFYFYFSDPLAYTFLNAGLYLASMMGYLPRQPGYGHHAGRRTICGDRRRGGRRSARRLDQRRRAGHRHSCRGPTAIAAGSRPHVAQFDAMLTVALVQVLSHLLDLSTSTAIISVMLLTITPDYQSLLHKGELRIAGALLAIAYAMVALILLVHHPSFTLLIATLFLGTFLAVGLAEKQRAVELCRPANGARAADDLGSAASGVRLALSHLRVGGAVGSGVVDRGRNRWAAFAPAPPLPRRPPDAKAADPGENPGGQVALK